MYILQLDRLENQGCILYSSKTLDQTTQYTDVYCMTCAKKEGMYSTIAYITFQPTLV